MKEECILDSSWRFIAKINKEGQRTAHTAREEGNEAGFGCTG